MTAYAVLNDESLSVGGSKGEINMLTALFETFQALQSAVAVPDQPAIRAYIAKATYSMPLPSGDSLRDVLRSLSRTIHGDMANRLRIILTKAAQTLDENDANTGPVSDTEVTFGSAGQAREAPALRAAWVLGGLAWSAAQPPWHGETISIQVRDAPGAFRGEVLANACRPEISPVHRAVLARQHMTVLPDFDHEDCRHVFGHRTYDKEKSHIPEHAARILTYAVPVEGGAKWWAKCACGFYHRFSGSQQQPEPGRMRVHWNGTTNPNATGNRQKKAAPTIDTHVPLDVRNKLTENAKVSGLANGECGCRELK
jgi:hypothetical protein